jgi:hypothetical protein
MKIIDTTPITGSQAKRNKDNHGIESRSRNNIT